jgi:hypothetical protein
MIQSMATLPTTSREEFALFMKTGLLGQVREKPASTS